METHRMLPTRKRPGRLPPDRATEGARMTVGPSDSSRVPRYAGTGHVRPAAPAGRGRHRRCRRGRRPLRLRGLLPPRRPLRRGNGVRHHACCVPTTLPRTPRPSRSPQVADAGDIAANPFDINEAVDTVERRAGDLLGHRRPPDDPSAATTPSPSRCCARWRSGTDPSRCLHFDAHLDTWDTYFGAEYTHGTPFRRAVRGGCIGSTEALHVGTAGPLYGKRDLDDDHQDGLRDRHLRRCDAAAACDEIERCTRTSGTALCTSPSTSTCSTRRTRPAPARPRPAGSPPRTPRNTAGPGLLHRLVYGGRGGGRARVRPRGSHLARRLPHGVRTGHPHGSAALSDAPP